ncbi:MAG: hypothetical protein MUF42_08525 [Cytophagaceae bacterium]|jgi:uncharacterized protein YpmB|nr:hypothetical protein [Cytophagaceae bacterium]
MKYFFWIVALIIFQSAWAQDPMKEFDSTIAKSMDSSLLREAEVDKSFQKARISQYEFEAARYQYYKDSLQSTRKVFDWQYISSIILFFTVIVIVFTGILFAAIQFRKSMKSSTEAAKESNEVELSLKGVKVNSSVLGVVILVISLAFFYLYLIYVYPISEVKPTTVKEESSKEAVAVPEEKKP